MEEVQPGQVISPQGTPVSEQPVAFAVQNQEPMSQVTSQDVPEQVNVSGDSLPTHSTNIQDPQTQPLVQPVAVPVTPTEPIEPATPPPVPSPATYTNQEQPPNQRQESSLAWSAAEYIHHEKNILWYGVYVLGTALLSGVVYLTTKDLLSTAIVFVAILGLVFLASRKPRVQDYSVDGDSLRVGQKVYHLHDFKEFSVAEEGSMAEIILQPLKRFMPPISVYVTLDQADDLAEYLADFLPFEPHTPDAMDSLLRRIRF